MSVVDDFATLPGDLRREPMAAVAFGLSVACLAVLPVAIYGGNVVFAGAMAVAGLAWLTKADSELEEST